MGAWKTVVLRAMQNLEACQEVSEGRKDLKNWARGHLYDCFGKESGHSLSPKNLPEGKLKLWTDFLDVLSRKHPIESVAWLL